MYPTTFLHAVFSFPLCSVYCNTLLANLNGRAYIRGGTTTTNIDADLFTNVTSGASNSIKGDKTSPRVASFRTSGEFSSFVSCAYPMMMIIPVTKSEGQGGVSLLPVVTDRPMTPTSENVCA